MDSKAELPTYTDDAGTVPLARNPALGFPVRPRRTVLRRSRGIKFITLACLALIVLSQWKQVWRAERGEPKLAAAKLQENLQTCAKLRTKPSDPSGLGRERNARYIDGHKPTLIRNATIWVGEPVKGTSASDARAGKGWEWIHGDIFLEHGLIKQVYKGLSTETLPADTIVFDAAGKQVTTGIIDMHSHAGVGPLPSLRGNEDTNEMGDDITPWARSIDSFKPLDSQIQTIKSGGVTTSLVLPGSGNNIGGEAFVFKFAVGKPDGRDEIAAVDMLADPDRNWRYMKMACGENAKRVHGAIDKVPTSRMGESYAFRRAFESARSLVQKQDDWCDKAAAIGVENMEEYLPETLQWETLAAAMRGQVHINIHCYTVADLEAMVDHTNEFQFAVRAFHHAHETYLVPDILKRVWGGRAPSSALFADNMYYKAEAYLGSVYAGKHLYEAGLTPIYVSDNPVLNAQHVLFEAAKAHHWGLPYHAALSSVTSAPAEELGLGKRLGKIKPGYDADIVVWDSDPLSIGATPVQVWIDGTAQFENPFVLEKPLKTPIIKQDVPDVGTSETAIESSNVVFTGVTNVWIPGFDTVTKGEPVNVVVKDGEISCVGPCVSQLDNARVNNATIVDLKDGHLTKAFTAFGGSLGLNEIDAEKEASNGNSGDKFTRAVDGLQMQGIKLAAALTSGVTRSMSAPVRNGPGSEHGVSVGFLTNSQTSLDPGAVFSEELALHYSFGLSARDKTSYAALFGDLRSKLLKAIKDKSEVFNSFSEEAYLQRVVNGDLTLVASVDSADGIATLLRVKSEVEKANDGARIRVAVFGGAEAFILADALAAAKVDVILSSFQPLGLNWDQRRALTGAPLTNGTAITRLVEAGVTVAVGLGEDWQVRDLGFGAAAAHINSEGLISEREALDLVSGNLYKILGVKEDTKGHFVVHQGSPIDITSTIVAVGGGQKSVSVFASS